MTSIPMSTAPTVDPHSDDGRPHDDAGNVEPSLDRSSADGAHRTRSSLFERHGLTTLDVLVMFTVVLLTCAYTPFLFTWFWAPRAILMFVALPAGLVATALLARRRDTAALWGVALIAWATLSAALSGGFFASFRGFVGQDTTVLFWAAALGLYSLGRLMSANGRAMFVRVSLCILAVHASMGALQMLARIEDGNLGLLYGRSIGLTPNPVFFGGFMAMAVALCLHRSAVDPERVARWSIGAGLFAVALSFSGSRVALAAVVVVSALVLAQYRQRSVVIATIGTAAGIGIGTMISRLVGTGLDATSRLSDTTSGGRLTFWRLASDAVLDRPILGWGLGRFRTAIQGDLTFDYVASIENSQVQWDAHNLFVGTAVAIGLPGLVLLSGFIWSAGRRASGTLAFVVLAVAITWMLQPAALMTLPFAMVALGAADSGERRSSSQTNEGPAPVDASPVAPVVWTAALVVGVAAGGWLGVAEYRLSEAVLDGDPDRVAAAAAMYPRDPIVSNVSAASYLALEPLHPEYGAPARHALERSVEYESTRPRWWTELANRQGAEGDTDAALISTRRALALQPTDATAWELIRQIGIDTDDTELVTESEEALCLLGFELVC